MKGLPGAFSLLSLLQGFATSPALGAELSVTPTLDLTQEYNDNILFSETNRLKDNVTQITPRLHAAIASETYSITGGGFVSAWEYWEETDLDTVDRSADLSITLKAAPRLDSRISGSYLKDTTLESEIEATGLVLSRTDRQRRSGAAGFSYSLDERTSADFDFTHTDLDYDDPNLVGYTANVFGLKVPHATRDERGMITAAFYLADYRFDPNEYEDYGVTLGYRYQFTEQSTIDLAGGARRTWSRIQTPGGSIEERDWGGVANIALTWQSEKDSVTTGYVRGLTPSGRGEPINSNRVYITALHHFSERVTGAVTSDYFYSTSEGVYINTRQKFFRVRPSLSAWLLGNIQAHLAYEHARSCDDLADTDADRDRIYLTISGTWPRKYHSP